MQVVESKLIVLCVIHVVYVTWEGKMLDGEVDRQGSRTRRTVAAGM